LWKDNCKFNSFYIAIIGLPEALFYSQIFGFLQLLNSVLSELKNGKEFHKQALVVELHGLMHTDDRLALKDATRQMQLETTVGSKVFGSFSG
jgi:hypothetical protein